jgi:hypothetical protein
MRIANPRRRGHAAEGSDAAEGSGLGICVSPESRLQLREAGIQPSDLSALGSHGSRNVRDSRAVHPAQVGPNLANLGAGEPPAQAHGRRARLIAVPAARSERFERYPVLATRRRRHDRRVAIPSRSPSQRLRSASSRTIALRSSPRRVRWYHTSSLAQRCLAVKENADPKT